MRAVLPRRVNAHWLLRRVLPWVALVLLLFALGSLGAAAQGTGVPAQASLTPCGE